MPATTYRIWGWGGPVGSGINGAVKIGVQAVAKPAPPDHPMELVNEIICGDLGRAIRLPIPPSAIVKKEKTGVLHHASLNFSESGQNLPPGDPVSITKEQPNLSCGVILFDLWIGNDDRHEKNLAYDQTKKTLQLIDHGRALLCGMNGRQRLRSLDDRRLINGHCLTGELTSVQWFKEWSDRIKSVPKFFVVDAVNDAKNIGLADDDADFCVEFLLKRRSQLLRIVKKYRDEFFNCPATLPGLP